MKMDFSAIVRPAVMSLVFSTIGLVMFAVAFKIITMIAPFSMRKEIEEDQNIALGIMVGAVMLGLAIIIAAAIHGG
jgi:putative membrane protein